MNARALGGESNFIPSFSAALKCALCVVGALFGGTLYAIYQRYKSWKICTSEAVLTGKTVIITGANSGIGFETAVDMAKRKARIILACRSVERGEKAAVEVRKRSGSDNVIFSQLDLSSLDSVRQFSAKIVRDEPQVDILINNAGIITSCAVGSSARYVFEPHIAVNHLGHFLLTNLLLDHMKRAPFARIVVVSSSLHKRCDRFDFENMNVVTPERYVGATNIAYCQSKLANILFVRALANRLKDTSVTVNAVHPGFVKTNLGREQFQRLPTLLKPLAHVVLWIIGKSPWQGAQTIIHCAVAEEVNGISGKYFGNCCEEEISAPAVVDVETAERLWEVSATMVQLDLQC